MQTKMPSNSTCAVCAVGLVLVAWATVSVGTPAGERTRWQPGATLWSSLTAPLLCPAGSRERATGASGLLTSYRAQQRFNNLITKGPSTLRRAALSVQSEGHADTSSAGAARPAVPPSPLSVTSPPDLASGSPAACVTVDPPAASDTTNLQEIVDHLPHQGGCVALAPGVYPIFGLRITKHLLLMGSGRNATVLEMEGEGTALEIRSPLVTIQDLTLHRKPDNRRRITYLIDGEGSHQLRLVRVVLGGADVAEIRLNQVFNVAMESLIVNAWHPRTSIGLSLDGSPAASTTVFVTACEFNNFLAAIDIHNTYGVVMDKNIFVGNSDAVRLNSGKAMTLLGNWVESGDLPSTYALHLTSPAVGQVFAAVTWISGTPPSSYVRFTGGATRSQILIFDFTAGPTALAPDVDLKGNLSIPAGAELLFRDNQNFRQLGSNPSANDASHGTPATFSQDTIMQSDAGTSPALASTTPRGPTIGLGWQDGDLWFSRRDDHAGEQSVVIGQQSKGGGLIADLRDGLKIGGGTVIRGYLSEKARVDFPGLKGPACAPDAAISVPEAAVGDTVTLAAPAEAMLPGVQFFAWVSAPSSISIRACAFSGSVPPIHGTFGIDVWKH